MSVGITIEALPALRGDCLWIECRRDAGPPWRLLVDGGLPATWPVLQERIRRAQQGTNAPVHFDLAVVSHIDADHIGGMLPLFASSDPPVTFGDIWFNGLPQLPEKGQTRSVAQGESLVRLLQGDGTTVLPWNERFGRRAVMTTPDAPFIAVTWPDGPTLTLLSPTQRRLEQLRVVWTAELLRLQRGEVEPERPPVALPLDDLTALAALKTTADQSAANGSSIAFLLEYAGSSCLLAADAFSSVLGGALTALANARGGEPVGVDVFKLPHHGSASNVTADLLRVVPARRYLVSTNGDRFSHPDDVALARVVTTTPPGGAPIELCFNYATPATLRWSDPALLARHHFVAHYPDPPDPAGIRIDLPAPARG